MPQATPRRKSSSLTSTAVYLKALRLILDEAIETRRLWVRKLGMLMESANTSHRGTIVQAVGRVGVDQAAVFRKVRSLLDRLDVPPACENCHAAVTHWLDSMVLACDVMVEIGRSAELTRMRETQEHLASGRADARRFNSEYVKLLNDLRRRAKAAAKPKKAEGNGLSRFVRRVRAKRTVG